MISAEQMYRNAAAVHLPIGFKGMLKMKKAISLLMLCAVSACCCGCNWNPSNDRSKKTSDNIMNSIIESIEEKDIEKMLGMFSVKAKNEAQNIEEQTKKLFEKFNDNNLKFEENAGPIVYDNTEGGNKSKKIINWYNVQGQNGKYTIFFVYQAEDTADNDNIGLYTLRIIHEKDFEEQFTEHDEMEIAGIYYNPSDN